MIYTVTLNPSLDYVLAIDTPEHSGGEPACRARTARFLPGGKGVNVSLMLRRLGIPSIPMGLCAGVTGRCLLDQLSEAGLEPDFLLLCPDAAPGIGTRINVKLREEGPDGVSLLREINTAGEPVPPDAPERLADRLAHRLGTGDLLVLAGSIPPTVPANVYGEFLRRIRTPSARDVRFAADTTGAPMKHLLPHHPWLIKPNRAELSELSGIDVPDDRTILRAARELQKAGAGHILVTLGADGMLFVPAPQTDDMGTACLRVTAVRGRARSSAGAGDATLAGFLAAYKRGDNPADILRYATSCGAAAAFSEGGMGSRADVDRLYAQVSQTGLPVCEV